MIDNQLHADTDGEHPETENALVRLSEQRHYDAERGIEDRDYTIDRLRRENEYLRLQAMKFGDNEPPEVVAQVVKHSLPYYTRNRWQKLSELLAPSPFETPRKRQVPSAPRVLGTDQGPSKDAE